MQLELAICTFNRASALGRCLEAIARQQASDDWRVTVIDNASTDRTAQVVAEHIARGRIPGLRRLYEPQAGLTNARQHALRNSSADWVALVDDDCLLRTGWVEATLAATAAWPEVGAFGGRVVPDYGRPVPPHLANNGWLFAEQEHGPDPQEVWSLVGTGLVLNRPALAATGWIDAPFIADRIGRGNVSGGDVEISMRLVIAGRALRYEPGMVLDHLIARDRQSIGAAAKLAAGLGAGSVLAALLTVEDIARFLDEQRAASVVARRRHRKALTYVLRGQYRLGNWRILDGFQAGQARQIAQVAADVSRFAPLIGACRRPEERPEAPT